MNPLDNCLIKYCLPEAETVDYDMYSAFRPRFSRLETCLIRHCLPETDHYLSSLENVLWRRAILWCGLLLTGLIYLMLSYTQPEKRQAGANGLNVRRIMLLAFFIFLFLIL